MLVEVMFAVALLGIFGSTLFMSQTFLFQKISKSHFSEQVSIKVDNQILEYKMKMKEAELANQPITIPSISKKYDDPEIEITTSGAYFTLPKKETSSSNSEEKKPSLFKIQSKVTHQFGEEKIYLLLYKPQPEEAS
jgi:uncharacterized protein YihD (DUF1040 family)